MAYMKFTSPKTLFLLLTSMLLTACGTVSNKTGVDTLAPGAFTAKDKGVVVISAGAPEHCMSMATALALHDAATKKVVPAPSMYVDTYAHKSDFPDHHGTVNALQLPVGTYVLTPMVMNPYVATISTPTFEFDVKAGELTYLGELFMPASCGLSTKFEVRDFYDRDMAIAAKKNTEISTFVAVKRLLRKGTPVNYSK